MGESNKTAQNSIWLLLCLKIQFFSNFRPKFDILKLTLYRQLAVIFAYFRYCESNKTVLNSIRPLLWLSAVNSVLFFSEMLGTNLKSWNWLLDDQDIISAYFKNFDSNQTIQSSIKPSLWPEIFIFHKFRAKKQCPGTYLVTVYEVPRSLSIPPESVMASRIESPPTISPLLRP